MTLKEDFQRAIAQSQKGKAVGSIPSRFKEIVLKGRTYVTLSRYRNEINVSFIEGEDIIQELNGYLVYSAKYIIWTLNSEGEVKESTGLKTASLRADVEGFESIFTNEGRNLPGDGFSTNKLHLMLKFIQSNDFFDKASGLKTVIASVFEEGFAFDSHWRK